MSGNPTPILEPVTKSSSSPTITSFEERDLIWEEFKAYLIGDSFPPGNNDPVDLLLEKFVDELALITFPPGNDDLPIDIESDLREIKYFLNHDPTKEMDSILEDSVDKGNLADPNNDLVDTIPEMFTDEHALDYFHSTIILSRILKPLVLVVLSFVHSSFKSSASLRESNILNLID
ncbi:hypothetical protein Tco_1354363 [Tanacetum coccineum]